jgi:hypothetical protein
VERLGGSNNMAHFAKLDENNIVTDVIVVGDEYAETYTEVRESHGEKYIQTSYNTYGGVHRLGGTPLRKNYAMVGGTYDEERDAFLPIKNFDSWVLNEETCCWEAPVAKPNDGPYYLWDEDTISWVAS